MDLDSQGTDLQFSILKSLYDHCKRIKMKMVKLRKKKRIFPLFWSSNHKNTTVVILFFVSLQIDTKIRMHISFLYTNVTIQYVFSLCMYT